MRLVVAIAVALAFACFGLAACGTVTTPQGGLDMAVASSSDGSGAGPDMAGPHAPPDGAASVTCGQGFICNNNCGTNQMCAQACLDMINTPRGQALFKAMQKCFSLAAVGACASKCGMAGQECGVCIFMACQSDIAACNQDM